jgi:membrane-associated phospholipid phosphatase
VGNIEDAAENCDESRIASPRRTVGVGGACVIVLLGLTAWVIASIDSRTGLAQLDRPMLDGFLTVRSPDLDAAVTAFTNLGRTVPMLIIGLALTAVLFVAYRRWSVWVLMAITPILSVNLTSWLKVAFARPRPPFVDAVAPYEPEFSFPSGHTLNSVAVTGMLAYLTVWLARQAWLRIAAVVAALSWSAAMSTSRVYLGHHWLTDVLGAWGLGLTLLALLITVHQLFLAWFAAR